MLENENHPSHEQNANRLSLKERGGIAILLVSIAAIISYDLFDDFQSGSSLIHLLIESLIALGSLVGAYVIFGRYVFLRHENESLRQDVQRIKASEKKWQEESKRHIEGLAQAIDDQLVRWSLTPAEKEVSLLLLKGLSLKDIAKIRSCSEKTVRQHSLMIYSKSGLAGRAELAAFFLEDLLSPVSGKRFA